MIASHWQARPAVKDPRKKDLIQALHVVEGYKARLKTQMEMLHVVHDPGSEVDDGDETDYGDMGVDNEVTLGKHKRRNH